MGFGESKRSRQTRERIKRGFLDALQGTPYDLLTVAALCRAAGVSRGAFYAHYDNTSDLLDEVLDDVFANVKSILCQVELIEDDPGEGAGALPFCLFVRANKPYQALFFDDGLRTRVAEKAAQAYRAQLRSRYAVRTDLSEEQLDALFTFQINGCLSALKKNRGCSDGEWAQVQAALDRFIKGGLCEGLTG